MLQHFSTLLIGHRQAKGIIMNTSVEWTALLLGIWAVLGSNLGP